MPTRKHSVEGGQMSQLWYDHDRSGYAEGPTGACRSLPVESADRIKLALATPLAAKSQKQIRKPKALKRFFCPSETAQIAAAADAPGLSEGLFSQKAQPCLRIETQGPLPASRDWRARPDITRSPKVPTKRFSISNMSSAFVRRLPVSRPRFIPDEQVPQLRAQFRLRKARTGLPPCR